MTRLRQLSSEESTALEWWAQFITEAEVVTGNPKAVRSPHGYARDLALDLWKKNDILPAIVAEWRTAAQERRLDEPLWPNKPRHRVNSVLEAVA